MPKRYGGSELLQGVAFEPAGPLWKRAPTQDRHGRPLSDFMMLIPGLGKRPAAQLERVLEAIRSVLDRYADAVVFADLNLHLNVLWVSVRPIPGICLELATALNSAVPESRLVAQRVPGVE